LPLTTWPSTLRATERSLFS